MVRVINSSVKLTSNEIKQFEEKVKITLPAQYTSFLLEWNGGKARPNTFYISEAQGESVVSDFFPIGNMDENLEQIMSIYENRLPMGFIPIGEDPGGNLILLGTLEPYCGYVYFWDHEQEPEEPDDMRNMHLLAVSFYAFLDKLYADPDDEQDAVEENEN